MLLSKSLVALISLLASVHCLPVLNRRDSGNTITGALAGAEQTGLSGNGELAGELSGVETTVIDETGTVEQVVPTKRGIELEAPKVTQGTA
ncbi:hypothetical protein NA57DRAFT_70233 [Rhizodiscina lignyota]|uniref:Secreted protein n=1 Tax=Rhizodiscina lignyota TaxID=1504668 RepID=A0A9P4MFZ6_9PEZI|nr:hypothetical protein NA57DRAFT_70233 [Rhizodiscina lignyota]